MKRNSHVGKLPYPAETLGHVRIEADPTTVAGSMATVHIVYTAGKFGVDDQGSVRFLLRFASDAGRPQFDRPGAPNYCTATASNGTKLLVEYHPRGAFRPWFKAIRVNVMRESLREGDTLTLVLGDRSQGGAGWRTSTMREKRFEIRVQVDPFGTVVYGDVAGEATLDLISGDAHVWKAVLPTLRRVAEPFELRIRADDACGNPVHRLADRIALSADGPLEGLPANVAADGATIVISGLRASSSGTVRVSLRDATGVALAESNPLVVTEHPRRSTWWGDFHAQSEETIGTNSARDYFVYARDKAFCDFVGHQCIQAPGQGGGLGGDEQAVDVVGVLVDESVRLARAFAELVELGDQQSCRSRDLHRGLAGIGGVVRVDRHRLDTRRQCPTLRKPFLQSTQRQRLDSGFPARHSVSNVGIVASGHVGTRLFLQRRSCVSVARTDFSSGGRSPIEPRTHLSFARRHPALDSRRGSAPAHTQRRASFQCVL